MIPIIALILLGAFSLTAQTSAQTCDARLVWERMIEAKGGREKLNDIESLLVKGDKISWHGLSKRHVVLRTLYRFPDFVWSWFDHGVSTLGTSVSQCDANRGVLIGADDSGRLTRGPAHLHISPMEPAFLLETRWMRPTLDGGLVSGSTTAVTVPFSQIPYPLTHY